jgi:hypothetical protein
LALACSFSLSLREFYLPCEHPSSFVRKSRPTYLSRRAQWRAAFAVELHESLDAPEFPDLQRWMMCTPITILMFLVQRFWIKSHLGLMSRVLEIVHIRQP